MEMAMEAMEVRSTFEGHVLPGSMFILWAIWWIVEAIVRGEDPRADRTLERGPVLPVIKVVLPLVGVWVEIPGQGWYPGDVMMSWQHVTMYSVFSLSGFVDLAARRGVVSHGSTYIAFAAAQTNAGFLFWGHTGHGGVEGVVHALLAMLFFGVAGLAVAEMARPAPSLTWARRGAQIALGSWFIIGAWIIYLSGWDLAAQFREGWTSMVFSWTLVAVVAVTVAAAVLAKSRARSREGTA